jgi:signal transduction histidine kinase
MSLAGQAVARVRRCGLGRGQLPEVALALFVGLNLVWMAFWPGWWEVPYHLAYLSVTVVYGLRSWRTGPTLLLMVTLTGLVAIVAVTISDLGPETVGELAGLPLVMLTFAAMVFHVERRRRAVETVDGLASERARVLEEERLFFARASHELLTPLTVARGHVELLGRWGPPSPDELETTRTVLTEELIRMEGLIAELLLVAKLASGVMARDRVDVDELVRAVTSHWTTLSNRAWRVWLEANGTIDVAALALVRAFESLLENAYRHTKEGDAILVMAAADGDRLLLVVEDRGEGIPPEALPHVFDRFYQVQGGGGGAGLGLSIVKAVVDAHGGQVRIASRLGKGTRVEMELPGLVAAPGTMDHPRRRPDRAPLER